MGTIVHTRRSTLTLGQVTAIAGGAVCGFVLGGALMVVMPPVAMLVAVMLLILRAVAAHVRAIAATVPPSFVVGFLLAVATYWALALAW